MREIKFRAWDKESKIMHSWEDLFRLMDLVDVFQDEDLILMQYTGLKDKNGKEIYEGDILTGKDAHNRSYGNWVVMWWPEFAQFVFGNGSLDVEKAAKEEFIIAWRDEIIGDIHTMPKLMEKPK